VGAAESIRHHLDLLPALCLFWCDKVQPWLLHYQVSILFWLSASYDVYLSPPTIRSLCPLSQSLSKQPVLIPYLLLP